VLTVTQTTQVENSYINIKLKKIALVGERIATKYIHISYDKNNTNNSLLTHGDITDKKE